MSGLPRRIAGGLTARDMVAGGVTTLITPDGDFLYPDNADDEALMVRAHGAARVVGLLCRCMVCCCRPGTGHRTLER